MAGSSNTEEENYWPGYVDALTTMTMVLTFIMMVLGVVVFMMSQNISRHILQGIAEAARIDTKALAGKPYEEQRDAVLSELERRSGQIGPSQSVAAAAALAPA